MATSTNNHHHQQQQNMSAEDMKKRKELALGLLEAYKGKIDSGLKDGSVADMRVGLRGLFKFRLMVDEDDDVKYWKSWLLAYAEDALFEAIDRQKAQMAADKAAYEAYLEEKQLEEEEEIPPPPPVVRPKEWERQEEADVVKELSEEEKQSMVQLEALEKELEQKIVPLESGKLKTHLINLFLPKVDGVAHHGNMEIKQRRKALIKKADSLDGGEKRSSTTTEGNGEKVEVKAKAAAKTKTKGKVGKKKKTSGKWHKRAVKVALFPARVAVMGLCKGLRLAKAGVMEASRLRFSLEIYRKGGEYDDDATYMTDSWD